MRGSPFPPLPPPYHQLPLLILWLARGLPRDWRRDDVTHSFGSGYVDLTFRFPRTCGIISHVASRCLCPNCSSRPSFLFVKNRIGIRTCPDQVSESKASAVARFDQEFVRGTANRTVYGEWNERYGRWIERKRRGYRTGSSDEAGQIQTRCRIRSRLLCFPQTGVYSAIGRVGGSILGGRGRGDILELTTLRNSVSVGGVQPFFLSSFCTFLGRNKMKSFVQQVDPCREKLFLMLCFVCVMFFQNNFDQSMKESMMSFRNQSKTQKIEICNIQKIILFEFYL